MKSLVSGIASWKPTSSTALNKACRMLLLSAPAIGVTELAVRILDRNQLQPSMQQLERAIAIPCNFLAWATCETGKFLMFPLQGNQFRFSCLEVAPPIIATIMIIYFFSRAREAPRRHTAPFGDIVKSCGLALSASSHFSKLPVVFHSLLRHL